MEANTLRKGNYVDTISRQNKVNIASGMCFQVLTIGLYSVDVLKSDLNPAQNKFIEKFLYDLTPIPLTQEWLLKLGFEEVYRSPFRLKYDHEENFSCGYDYDLKESNNGMQGFRYFGHYIEIEYVHQLQNLFFALTGKELTLKTEL